MATENKVVAAGMMVSKNERPRLLGIGLPVWETVMVVALWAVELNVP